MKRIFLLLGLMLLMAGCAVVNVYVTFPQEKIDRAAEGFLLDIQKEAPGGKPADKPARKSSLNFLRFVQPAPLYGQTITSNVQTESPKTDEARSRMKERLEEIDGYKAAGLLGENKEWQIEIRSTGGLGKEEKANLRELVKEENADRMTICREIIRINNMPPTELKNVQAGFARAQRKLAKKGEWLQNEDGAWVKKK